MTTSCPVCAGPMSVLRRGQPRVYCSRRCRDTGWADKSRTPIDPAAVLRLLQGSPVDSTRGERIEAVAALTAHGRSASWIAEYLHTTPRSVIRYRAELHKRKAVA